MVVGGNTPSPAGGTVAPPGSAKGVGNPVPVRVDGARKSATHLEQLEQNCLPKLPWPITAWDRDRGAGIYIGGGNPRTGLQGSMWAPGFGLLGGEMVPEDEKLVGWVRGEKRRRWLRGLEGVPWFCDCGREEGGGCRGWLLRAELLRVRKEEGGLMPSLPQSLRAWRQEVKREFADGCSLASCGEKLRRVLLRRPGPVGNFLRGFPGLTCFGPLSWR